MVKLSGDNPASVANSMNLQAQSVSHLNRTWLTIQNTMTSGKITCFTLNQNVKRAHSIFDRWYLEVGTKFLHFQ